MRPKQNAEWTLMIEDKGNVEVGFVNARDVYANKFIPCSSHSSNYLSGRRIISGAVFVSLNYWIFMCESEYKSSAYTE